MQGNEPRKKEEVSTKKTSKISKKSSPRASDTGKGRINITPQTYGTEEVCVYVCVCMYAC